MIVQKMPLPKNPCTLPRSRWLHAGRQRKWPILRKERLLTRRRRWWLEAHHSDRVKGPKLGWENWIERFQNWRNFGPFLKGGNFGGFFRGRITVRMQEDKKTKRKFQMWIFQNSRLRDWAGNLFRVRRLEEGCHGMCLIEEAQVFWFCHGYVWCVSRL